MYHSRFIRSVKNNLLFYLYLFYIKTLRIQLPKKELADDTIIAVFHEGASVFSKVLKLALKNSRSNFCLLISNHQDGDLLQNVATNFKLLHYRINYHKVSELRNYLKVVKNQDSRPVIAVDGPVGPYHAVFPGIIFLQEKINQPIQFLTLDAPHCLRLKTWDRHVLPLPFSRIIIQYSEPFISKKKGREEKLEEFKQFVNNFTSGL